LQVLFKDSHILEEKLVQAADAASRALPLMKWPEML
jgi:hypothetical protein